MAAALVDKCKVGTGNQKSAEATITIRVGWKWLQRYPIPNPLLNDAITLLAKIAHQLAFLQTSDIN